MVCELPQEGQSWVGQRHKQATALFTLRFVFPAEFQNNITFTFLCFQWGCCLLGLCCVFILMFPWWFCLLFCFCVDPTFRARYIPRCPMTPSTINEGPPRCFSRVTANS